MFYMCTLILAEFCDSYETTHMHILFSSRDLCVIPNPACERSWSSWCSENLIHSAGCTVARFVDLLENEAAEHVPEQFQQGVPPGILNWLFEMLKKRSPDIIIMEQK